MRLACAILLLVGARAAGVAPAETLASAVPAEKKNPIDAVEATYGRVKQRWRDYLSKPKSKAADAPADAAKPAEKSAKPTEEPAPEKPKKSWFQKPRQVLRGLLRALCATIVVLGLYNAYDTYQVETTPKASEHHHSLFSDDNATRDIKAGGAAALAAGAVAGVAAAADATPEPPGPSEAARAEAERAAMDAEAALAAGAGAAAGVAAARDAPAPRPLGRGAPHAPVTPTGSSTPESSSLAAGGAAAAAAATALAAGATVEHSPTPELAEEEARAVGAVSPGTVPAVEEQAAAAVAASPDVRVKEAAARVGAKVVAPSSEPPEDVASEGFSDEGDSEPATPVDGSSKALDRSRSAVKAKDAVAAIAATAAAQAASPVDAVDEEVAAPEKVVALDEETPSEAQTAAADAVAAISAAATAALDEETPAAPAPGPAPGAPKSADEAAVRAYDVHVPRDLTLEDVRRAGHPSKAMSSKGSDLGSVDENRALQLPPLPAFVGRGEPPSPSSSVFASKAGSTCSDDSHEVRDINTGTTFRGAKKGPRARSQSPNVAFGETVTLLATPEEKTALDGAPRSPLQKPATPFTAEPKPLPATPEDRALDGAGLISALGSRTANSEEAALQQSPSFDQQRKTFYADEGKAALADNTVDLDQGFSEQGSRQPSLEPVAEARPAGESFVSGEAAEAKRFSVPEAEAAVSTDSDDAVAAAHARAAAILDAEKKAADKPTPGATDPFLDAVLSSEVVDMDSEADKDAAAIEASRSPPKPASRAGPSPQAEADAQKKASTCVCVVC